MDPERGIAEVWQATWPWLLGIFILALSAAALWLAFRRPRLAPADGLHERALEAWLAGDLTTARDLMHELVKREPHRSQPYLQLGTLLRLTGNPAKAAALHRSLAVRDDLPPGLRASVGLELAADLLAVARPEEADAVLGQLAAVASDQERWYRLRFAAALGRDLPEVALAALREGEKRLPRSAGCDRLRALRAAWLTDRSLQCARAGQFDLARRHLGQARKLPEAAARVFLLQAIIAAGEGDQRRALSAVAAGLAAHPAEMTPALPLLEDALWATGSFAMVIPILEAACREQTAPPDLWIALARLYEKLDRRQDALRLLADKRGDPRLTPEAAAPYLRLLTKELPGAAFSQVWNLLDSRPEARGFVCCQCGHRVADLQWFCAQCLNPDTFAPAPAAVVPVRHDADEPQTAPPRY